MNIIFPLIVFFLNTSPAQQKVSPDSGSLSGNIYLIKQQWHTGIVFAVDDIKQHIPELTEFNKYKYVDIGWGDEDFYQHPGFDAELAVKAIFYPTPSALRVEGFNFPIDQYIDLSDMAVVMEVSRDQLKILVGYIAGTFYKDEENQIVQLSSRYSGNIRFYKAKGEYHLFNTCNTWLAKGLSNAGIEMKEHIILAEQLFRECAEKGKVLKTMQDQETE